MHYSFGDYNTLHFNAVTHIEPEFVNLKPLKF